MDMHMFGLMQLPNASLNRLLVAPYVEKPMRLTSYRGAVGS